MGKIIINTKNFKIEIEDLDFVKEEEQQEPNERIINKKHKPERIGKIKIIKEKEDENEEKPIQKKGQAVGILHQRVRDYLLENPNVAYREAMKLLGEQMRNENK